MFDLYEPDQQASDDATAPSIDQILQTDPLNQFRWDFRVGDRTLQSGLSAVLYFQQEQVATGYDNREKPMKTSARVLLAMATSGSSEPNSQITALDFAVSIDGKLVQLPETLNLQTITATKPGDVPIPIALQQLKELDQAIPKTQAEVDRLQLMVDPALRSQLEHKQTRLRHLQNVLNSSYFDPAQNSRILDTLTSAIDSTARLIQALQADARLLQERRIETHLSLTKEQFTLVQNLRNNVQNPRNKSFSISDIVNHLKFIVERLNTQLAAQWQVLSNLEQNQLQNAQVELTNQITERDRLKAMIRNDVHIPMLTIVTDDNGLSVTGAVLAFAETIDTPQLSGYGKSCVRTKLYANSHTTFAL